MIKPGRYTWWCGGVMTCLVTALSLLLSASADAGLVRDATSRDQGGGLTRFRQVVNIVKLFHAS